MKTIWFFTALLTFWGLVWRPAFAGPSITCPTYDIRVFNLPIEEAEQNDKNVTMLPVGADESPIGISPGGGGSPHSDPADGWRVFPDGFGGDMWVKIYPKGVEPYAVLVAAPLDKETPYTKGSLPMNTAETERDFAGEFGPTINQQPGREPTCTGKVAVAINLRAPGVYAAKVEVRGRRPEYIMFFSRVMVTGFNPYYPSVKCPYRLAQYQNVLPPKGNLVYTSFSDVEENIGIREIWKQSWNIIPKRVISIDEIFLDIKAQIWDGTPEFDVVIHAHGDPDIQVMSPFNLNNYWQRYRVSLGGITQLIADWLKNWNKIKRIKSLFLLGCCIAPPGHITLITELAKALQVDVSAYNRTIGTVFEWRSLLRIRWLRSAYFTVPMDAKIVTVSPK